MVGMVGVGVDGRISIVGIRVGVEVPEVVVNVFVRSCGFGVPLLL